MYESYKHLIFGPLKSAKELLKSLSSDLMSIDETVLEYQHEVIDCITEEDEKLKELAILCRDKIYSHPQWGLLAGRVRMIYIYRTVPPTFREAVEKMKPVLGNKFYKFCVNNEDTLEKMIQRDLDWNFDIFSVETQIRGYLTKINDAHGKSILVETPQYKNLRIAAYLWYESNEKLIHKSLSQIKQMYLDISHGKVSPASPTQFNAGMRRPQLSSCFLLQVSDYLESLSNSWKYSAIISMINGGIGMVFDSIRHSEIGNSGQSKGIVPWIKIENEVLSTVDQCFHPDTIVYTLNGPKKISEVGPGEEMIRSDGYITRVAHPIVYNVDPSTDDFYKLYSSNEYFTIVSGCHPILSISDQSTFISFFDIIGRLKSNKALIEYKPVKEIETSAFIGVPIPTYEKDLTRYTEDDCRMYGILLLSGTFTNKRSYVKSTNPETLSFVREYLQGRGIEVRETKGRETRGGDPDMGGLLWDNQHHIFPFVESMFYTEQQSQLLKFSLKTDQNLVDYNDYLSTKNHFYPAFLHLPLEKLKCLVKGLLENLEFDDLLKYIRFLGNNQVVESLKYVLLRLKVLAAIGKHTILDSLLHIPKTGILLEILGKNFSIVNNSPFKFEYFEYDSKLWYRLAKKEKLTPEEISFTCVYDLEMETSEKEDFETTANYCTALGIAHNGGKRKGSGTMYLTDWHTDIFAFIDLKEPFGKEEMRAKDLFYGIMVSDLFMRRVENDDMWTLFCPAKTNGLEKTSGKEFEKRYIELENKIINGMHLSGTRRVKARELWTHILNSQISTGMPFLIYKDPVNRKSNQQHMGTLRTSNLCCEITEYVDEENIASCNLSSIPVSRFVKDMKGKIPVGNKIYKTFSGDKYFDFQELGEVTRRVVRNLGQTINRTYYPTDVPQVKYCNLRTRPLGIGIQDLAGCFALLDLWWDSKEAAELNERIARTMYYHGMDENVIMAEEIGAYATFPGSPASKGLFQFDLWTLEKIEKMNIPALDMSFDNLIDVAGKILCTDLTAQKANLSASAEISKKSGKSTGGLEDDIQEKMISIFSQLKEIFGKVPCDEFDWNTLRARMVKIGLYFSLLFTQMPTATSAQILGNNESTECYTQLLQARTVLSGQFTLVVDHLVKDLEAIDMWNNDVLKHLLANFGSIQTFPTENIEDWAVRDRMEYLKRKYKTAYEHSQKTFADLYLARAKYQCQSSSNNLFMKSPTLTSLNAYHFYMWKGGAKTGMYYLRQMPKSNPLNFALSDIRTSNTKPVAMDRSELNRAVIEEDDGPVCLVCDS